MIMEVFFGGFGMALNEKKRICEVFCDRDIGYKGKKPRKFLRDSPVIPLGLLFNGFNDDLRNFFPISFLKL